MPKKKSGWVNTCNRFVAFLDIMGFRERVFRESHEDVKKMLESLRPTIKVFEDLARLTIENFQLKTKLKDTRIPKPTVILPVSFSDSIILITSDKSIKSLSELLKYIKIIFFQAISEGIPMKGAIAFGEMTADKDNSLFFGRPLIDAFELQNELQSYCVILHHTVEKCFSELKTNKDFKDYGVFLYPVPTKFGKIKHYLVDWTYFPEEREYAIEFVSQLYRNVSGSPRLYVDNTLDMLIDLQKRNGYNLIKKS